jgi:hypothetical protein
MLNLDIEPAPKIVKEIEHLPESVKQIDWFHWCSYIVDAACVGTADCLRTALSDRCRPARGLSDIENLAVCEALTGLADEHCTNAKTHDEKPTEAVQQVHAPFKLCAVRIDNRDGDDGYETIKRVKRREHRLIAVDHDDAQDDLNKHGGLSNADVPPQGAGA